MFFTEEEETFEEYENDFEDVAFDETKQKAILNNINYDGSDMILIEPKSFSESQSISDHLVKSRSVVVNLGRVTPEQAKRIIDFLSGTCYAISGTIQKLGPSIFLCTPKTIKVTGEMGTE
jgi:cell division inhibitor SepF